MSEPNRCPECGAELPVGALGGLCPKCLLAAGLESRDEPGSAKSSGSQAPTTPNSGSFVPPDTAWLATHFPQLEILELLGHGGMGAVYKARQPKLDRLVALKIIRPESADDPAFAERFNREARMLARLNHPHIVAVYDFGSVDISLREMRPHAEREDYTKPSPLYFFLMEYVDGTNLRQLLQSGDLLPQQALAIVPQICEALQFAHDEGVVHRDIKPENILLDKRGRVKIADFGLAKLAAGTPQEFTLTGTHQVMGTPRYMAPEQMEGSHAVDHRADIYSLGVVFYEMLTGEVPMGHFDPPSHKVDIDVRLDEVVLRTLAREPERRYQHASDIKTDVNSITTTGPVPSSEPANIAWPYWRPTWQAYAAYSMVFALLLHSLVAAIYGNDVFWNKTVALATFATIVATSCLAYLIEKLRFDVRKSWRDPQNLLTVVLGFVMMLVPVLLPSPVELRDWLPSTTESFAERDERYLRILALGLWLWTFYYTAVHVWFALGWLIRHGSRPRGAAATGSSAPSSRPFVETAADREQIEVARQMVQFPAIGLLVVGTLSLASATLVAFSMSSWLFARARTSADDASGLLVVPVILIFVSLPLAMITGAVKMLRLTDYGWAVGAAVLAVSPIPAGPLWLLSLPIGIWSLVVLSKPEVKRGFVLRSRRKPQAMEHSNPPNNGERALGIPPRAPRLVFIVGVFNLLLGLLILTGVGASFAFPDVEPADQWLASNRAFLEWARIQTAADPWIGGVLAYLLFSSAIGLLLGRSWGRKLALLYSMIQLAWGMASWPLYAASMSSLAHEVSAAFDAEERMIIGSAVVALPFLCALELVYPLFVLIVLNRPRIRTALAERKTANFANQFPADPPSGAPRGTLGRAWDEWWAERDRWFTRSVLTVLILVHVACFAMFTALSGGGGHDSGRPFAWHHVGWPSPWFIYERETEQGVLWQRKIDFLSSSTLLAAVGILAWYAFWRIQLVRDAQHARLWRTIGSPTAIFIVWAVVGAALAALGANNAERLYESMRATKVKANSQQGDNYDVKPQKPS